MQIIKEYVQYYFSLAKFIHILGRIFAKLSAVISGWWEYELFIFLFLLLRFLPIITCNVHMLLAYYHERLKKNQFQ